MKDLFIIGSGGFSKQVIELIENINEKKLTYNILGLIDDDPLLIGKEVLNYKVVGDTKFLKKYSDDNKTYAVIAIANEKVRKKIARNITSVYWENLIHPLAIVSKYFKMSEGNIICAGVIINPDSVIGSHCHLNIGVTLGHDVKMYDYVTIMPGAKISGNTSIKNSSTIGTNSTIIQGLSIEENVVIGAGSTLIQSTESNSVYVGCPAKKIKSI